MPVGGPLIPLSLWEVAESVGVILLIWGVLSSGLRRLALKNSRTFIRRTVLIGMFPAVGCVALCRCMPGAVKTKVAESVGVILPTWEVLSSGLRRPKNKKGKT